MNKKAMRISAGVDERTSDRAIINDHKIKF